MVSVPKSRLYYFIEQGMHFRVTATLQVSRVERWICRVQREFLDRVPENSMCISLDCEYTDAVKNGYIFFILNYFTCLNLFTQELVSIISFS
jgi:hypothetical protein